MTEDQKTRIRALLDSLEDAIQHAEDCYGGIVDKEIGEIRAILDEEPEHPFPEHLG